MKNKQVRILLAGGGSGGHVTPLKAICDAMRSDSTLSVSLTLVVDRGFLSRAQDIFSDDTVAIKSIFAGKYRRYQSKSLMWHLTHLPTLLKNIRDVVYLGIGTFQSLIILSVHRPNVVFCKGGFVCIPVGLVARLLRIPIVIHDSDTRPGLTNRILSRWAQYIATGMPLEFYPYDASRSTFTGIPVSSAFSPISQSLQKDYKQQLGFDRQQQVLLVTGGGNGADSLNEKVLGVVGELLSSGWGIVHLAGKGKAKKLQQYKLDIDSKVRANWHIEEFADMEPRLLAADVVIARTSASTLQECANAQKSVVGVPSPHLEDQSMNADYFASKHAIIALNQSEASPEEIIKSVNTLSGPAGEKYARVLHSEFAHPNAAQDIVKLIFRVVE